MIRGVAFAGLIAAVVFCAAPAFAEEKAWSVLNSEVVALYREQKLSEAARVGRQAVEMAESTFGADHPNTAASLNNLAAVYHMQGKYSEAEDLYRRALSIDLKVLGKDHPSVKADRQNLEELLRFQGRTLDNEPVAEPKPAATTEQEQPTQAVPPPAPPEYQETLTVDEPPSSRSSSAVDEWEDQPHWIKAEFSLDNGYRVDNLKFNIAGDKNGFNPNILSELTWHDLESYQVKGSGRITFDKLCVVRGYLDYGWIFAGDNQDSDYLGNNRSFEFSRSNNNSDNGDLLDASLGLGVPFKVPSSRYDLTLTPLGGYSYHEQNLTITDGNQTLDPFGLFGTGPFPGLDSEYRARWEGPWAGLDLSFRMTRKLTFGSTLEYHWADYTADARWNLRTDFAQPKSFRHTARGHGVVGGFNAKYALTPRWGLHADVDVQYWRTGYGTDTTHFSNGTSVETRLNKVKWDSYDFLFGATYSY